MRERSTDVLIVGGGLGGVAAALGACRLGKNVILTEETDWLGGQLTAQAVPPDENRWIEQSGCTASYRQLRNGIRDYYRRYYPLLPGLFSFPFQRAKAQELAQERRQIAAFGRPHWRRRASP